MEKSVWSDIVAARTHSETKQRRAGRLTSFSQSHDLPMTSRIRVGSLWADEARKGKAASGAIT